MGDVLKAYFVPNGSYLMEMAEDGDKISAVETLQKIGREIRDVLRPDAVRRPRMNPSASRSLWPTDKALYVAYALT